MQKMLALLNPEAPPVTPTPSLNVSTPTHTPPSLAQTAPPRDRWRQTDGRRAPPFGQTTVVWRDAAQLKSTQLRMADMDRCIQDTPRPVLDPSLLHAVLQVRGLVAEEHVTGAGGGVAGCRMKLPFHVTHRLFPLVQLLASCQ